MLTAAPKGAGAAPPLLSVRERGFSKPGVPPKAWPPLACEGRQVGVDGTQCQGLDYAGHDSALMCDLLRPKNLSFLPKKGSHFSMCCYTWLVRNLYKARGKGALSLREGSKRGQLGLS